MRYRIYGGADQVLGFWPWPAFLCEVKCNQTKNQDDQAAENDAIHSLNPHWSKKSAVTYRPAAIITPAMMKDKLTGAF